jgi:hypothetical protein
VGIFITKVKATVVNDPTWDKRKVIEEVVCLWSILLQSETSIVNSNVNCLSALEGQILSFLLFLIEDDLNSTQTNTLGDSKAAVLPVVRLLTLLLSPTNLKTSDLPQLTRLTVQQKQSLTMKLLKQLTSNLPENHFTRAALMEVYSGFAKDSGKTAVGRVAAQNVNQGLFHYSVSHVQGVSAVQFSVFQFIDFELHKDLPALAEEVESEISGSVQTSINPSSSSLNESKLESNFDQLSIFDSPSVLSTDTHGQNDFNHNTQSILDDFAIPSFDQPTTSTFGDDLLLSPTKPPRNTTQGLGGFGAPIQQSTTFPQSGYAAPPSQAFSQYSPPTPAITGSGFPLGQYPPPQSASGYSFPPTAQPYQPQGFQPQYSQQLAPQYAGQYPSQPPYDTSHFQSGGFPAAGAPPVNPFPAHHTDAAPSNPNQMPPPNNAFPNF